MNKPWSDEYKYKRILEILDDYWISQQDELYVRVDMYFEHKNGETQSKRIVWINPVADEVDEMREAAEKKRLDDICDKLGITRVDEIEEVE